MGIRKLFRSSWEEVLAGASTYDDTDVLTEQRIIITNRNCGRVVWGQLVMMFDEDGKMSLITARYCVPALSFPAYLHTLEQRGRLMKEGIVCNVAFEHGLVTVTYSRVGWLERVARYSSAGESTRTPSRPTPSEESTVSSSPPT